jgi:hypothetical protein
VQFLAFLSSAISAIPRIVCETIHSLELHDETPSWKIMDNKGRVTVVLHWDQRHQDKQPAKGNEARSPNKRLGGERPSLVIQTSLDKLGTFVRSPNFFNIYTLLVFAVCHFYISTNISVALFIRIIFHVADRRLLICSFVPSPSPVLSVLKAAL